MLKIATMCVALSLSGSGTPGEWDFERDEVGGQPQEFYFVETNEAPDAKWQVVNQNSNHALAQLDVHQEDGPSRRALAVVDEVWFEHVTLTVDIKSASGRRRPQAGVVWRYRSSEDHLVACIDFSDRRVRLYRVVNGNRVQFGVSEEIPIKVNEWYKLRVEHRGLIVKVYLNDEAFIIEKDQHFLRGGRVGLWTQTDAATFFDNLHVAALEEWK